MNKLFIATFFSAIAIFGTDMADAAQDACFDLTNCGDEFGLNTDDDGIDYINYLRENYGIGIDAGGVCLDGSCNMTREDCQEYCDNLHDRLMEGCSGLMTARARGICRAQAMEEYARCLARCP